MLNAASVKIASLLFLIVGSFFVTGNAMVQLSGSALPSTLVAQAAADTVKPSNPTNLAATPAPTSIKLAWTASSDNVGVTGYQIYRNSALVGASATSTYTDTNLISNVAYTYYVRALDAANNSSGNSNIKVATTTVVSAGGTTGAVSITADFGAKCNGTDSDTKAFANFNAWALEWQKTNSATIHLALPSGGTCYFNEAGDAGWIARWWVKGIKKVVFDGNGATIKNGPQGSGFFLGSSAQVQDGNHSARLESVNSGASSVTLKDASKLPLYKVGNWVLVTGYDLQGLWGSPYGYPSNAHFFEYVQIASISGNTVTFTAPLKNTYLSTWPNYNSGNQWEVDNGGPATMYALDPSWDSEHTFKNMTIDSGSMGQMYSGGKLAAFENVNFPGASVIPTQNMTFIFDHVNTNSYLEVDKFIGSITIKNSTIGAMDFQSSSVDTLTVSDSEFVRFLNGTPKKTYFTNVKFNNFGVGTLYYGHTDEVVCTNCTVTNQFNTFGFNIDTTGWTMTNGVIKVPNTAHSLPWAVPGTKLFLAGSQGPSLSFRVVGVTQDTTSTYVQTNLSGGWPTIPLAAGASPKIQAVSAPKFTCTNCTGIPVVVDLSQAPIGAPVYSYTKRTYSGNFKTQSGAIVRGKLVSMKVNVVKPYTGTKSSVLMEALGQFGLFLVNSDGSVSRIDPLVNVKIAGERVITPATTTGSKAGDNINRSEPSNAATLPFKSWNVWFTNGAGVSMPDLSTEDPSTWPIVTIEIVTDQGLGDQYATTPQTNSPTPVITSTTPAPTTPAPTTPAPTAPTNTNTTTNTNTSTNTTTNTNTTSNTSTNTNTQTATTNTSSGAVTTSAPAATLPIRVVVRGVKIAVDLNPSRSCTDLFNTANDQTACQDYVAAKSQYSWIPVDFLVPAATTPATQTTSQSTPNTAVSTQPAVTTPTANSSGQGSVYLTSKSSPGARGNTVAALQKFLIATNYLTLPSDATLGYYGSLTQQAVQRFQAQQGVVQGGTPATTGFGNVGNKTIAAINANASAEVLQKISAIQIATVAPQTQTTTQSAAPVRTTTALPVAVSKPQCVTPKSDGTFGLLTQTLSVGSCSTQVITLQEILNSAGYTVAATGPGSRHNENIYYGASTAAAVKKFQQKYQITGDPSGTLGPATRAKLVELYSNGELK